MKVLIESEYLSRLIWLASICVVLICLAALFCFFPELPPVPQMRRPFAPQVRYRVAESYEHGMHGDSAELSAVWSPALISLPNGVMFPKFGKNHINWVMPPLEASRGRALFLERSAPDREYVQSLAEYWSSRGKRSATFRSMPLTGPPVFKRSRAEENNGVQMSFSEGLRGRSIDVSRLSLDEWVQPGASWALTLCVRFNETGYPVHVFLESPAVNNALNMEAVRRAYQCLTGPGDRCEGRITLWFSGNGSGTASDLSKRGTQAGL